MIYNDIQDVSIRVAGLVAGQYAQEQFGLKQRIEQLAGTNELAQIVGHTFSLYLAEHATDAVVHYVMDGQKPPSIRTAFSESAIEAYVGVVVAMLLIDQTGLVDSLPLWTRNTKLARTATTSVIYMVAEEIASKMMPMVMSYVSTGY